MKNIKILLCGLIVIQLSCRTNTKHTDSDPTPDPVFPQRVWSAVTPAIIKPGLSFTAPILYKNLVVVDQESSDTTFSHQYVWAYDRLTGEKKWQVDYPGAVTFSDVYHNENVAVYSSGVMLSAIDLDSGQKIWSIQKTGSVYVNGYENTLLHTVDYNSAAGPWSDSSGVFLTDIRNGHSRKVFTIKRTGNFCPGLAIPTMWLNGTDTVLFFQNRGIYDAKGFPGRVDLYAYNLSKSRIEWKIDSIEDVSSLVSKTTLLNGKLYFCGMRNVYCLSPQNGQIIWKWRSNEQNASMPTGNWYFSDNKIFVKPLCGVAYALNADSGQVLWSVRQSFGTNALNMSIYKGKLYQANWGDATINIVDVNSGLEVNKLKVDSANPISIDPRNGYLYFHDYVKLNCFKLSSE